MSARRRWWLRASAWAASVLALGAAVFGVWFWISSFQPARAYNEDIWRPTGENTPRRWMGIRDRMRRGFFLHDDMIRLRFIGDTESIERLMTRLPDTGRIQGCLGSAGPPHAAEALSGLTAHTVGDTAEEWHQWWQQHRGKSQAILIREAFIPLGIDPQRSPTREQALQLLRLAGAASDPGSDKSQDGFTPDHDPGRSRNALRILRDHNIKPEIVTHTDLLDPDGEALFRGLKRYIDFRVRYPVTNRAGVVFGSWAGDITFHFRDGDGFGPGYKMLARRWMPGLWFAGVAALAAGGLWGGWRLWRSRGSASGA